MGVWGWGYEHGQDLGPQLRIRARSGVGLQVGPKAWVESGFGCLEAGLVVGVGPGCLRAGYGQGKGSGGGATGRAMVWGVGGGAITRGGGLLSEGAATDRGRLD